MSTRRSGSEIRTDLNPGRKATTSYFSSVVSTVRLGSSAPPSSGRRSAWGQGIGMMGVETSQPDETEDVVE